MQKVEGSSPFIRFPGLRWPGAPPSATWRSWLTRRSAKPLFTGSSPVVASVATGLLDAGPYALARQIALTGSALSFGPNESESVPV